MINFFNHLLQNELIKTMSDEIKELSFFCAKIESHIRSKDWEHIEKLINFSINKNLTYAVASLRYTFIARHLLPNYKFLLNKAKIMYKENNKLFNGLDR